MFENPFTHRKKAEMKHYTMTKIVATLGPATTTKADIKRLYDAGVTMFRLNSSHETPAVHLERLNYIREIEKEEKTLIPVLLDLQGPKIRIGELKESFEIKKGELLKFKHQKEMVDGIIPVDYEGIADDVKPGEKILIDDGKLQLVAESVENGVITARVETGGLLKKRKGINIPGATGSIDVLTQQDFEYVNFAVTNNIDYLGLSFVRTADDVKKLKKILDNMNSQVKIISKIEKPQAVENIDEIISLSDGIMVARGDLGIEISTEKVPIVQKDIIRKANLNRKVVIVATQMLESMIENPIPTRAETSDVANAIFDGADAVMLSGETAAGKYPEEAVHIMKMIADNVESSNFLERNCFSKNMIESITNQSMAIGMAITDIIKNIDVKAIVTITASGYTPKFLSEARPSVPIFACCPQKTTCRGIKLYRGIYPIDLQIEGKIDKQTLRKIDDFFLNQMEYSKGDIVVFTGSIPQLLTGGTNFIKIHELGSTDNI